MRLAGTAIICILAAFGAAFLVARAVNHQTPARAATPPQAPVAASGTHAGTTHKINVELVSQFSPVKASLKPKPKPKRKPKKKATPPVSVTPSAPVTTTPVTTTPTYTQTPYTPSPTPTTSAPPSSTGGGGSSHHKKSGGGSGGSGTTTIGG